MRWREFLDEPRGREMAGILLTGMALLAVVSLASYSPADPSFFASTSARPSNWIGPAGAQVAALLYEAFGLAAWFLPMMLLAAALRRLRGGEEPLRRSAAIGLGLVGFSTAILLSLVVGGIRFRGAPLLAGGVAGKLTGDGLTGLFGDVGGAILAGILLLVGLTLAARSSLSESTAQGYEWLREQLSLLATLLRKSRSGRRAVAAKRSSPSRVRRSGWTGRSLLRRGWAWAAGLVRRGWPPRSGPPVESSGLAATETAGGGRPAPQPTVTARPPVQPAAKAAKRPAKRPVQAKLPVEMPAGRPVRLPPPELLNPVKDTVPVDRRQLLATARLVEGRCAEFAVDGKVQEIHPGPVVTTFEFHPEAGIKLSRITGLADDLALGLEAESVRIDRIPGRSAVGMEVPNKKRETIALREVIESEDFRRPKDLLTLGLGKTQDGQIFCASLAKMPHLLIAGSTGSGKSVGLNAIVASILYRARPEEVKFILVDPKMLELGIYDGMPHLLVPVVTDMKLAANALRWGVREMERRYRLLAACNVRHLDAYNRLLKRNPEAVEKAIEGIPQRGSETYKAEHLPYIVIVVDELADMLMTTGQEVEEAIARLAQKARAVGLHLVLATQRPSVDVLTGAIKANFPARIAFRVASKIDSRTILDASGAEKLLGAGDMLYRPPGSSRLTRVHGAWVSEEEGLRLVAWLKQQAKAEYNDAVLAEPPVEAGGEGAEGVGVSREDPVYRKAVRLIVATGHGSTSFLQRKMRLGYSRAARIIDQMEEEGIIGPPDGSKPRQALVGTEFLERMDQQDDDPL